MIVADTGNNRVQVLTTGGMFLRLIGGHLDKGKNPKIFSFKRLMVNNPDLSDKHGKLTRTNSDLNQPEDVAVTSDGLHIIVADTGNPHCN